MIGRTVSHYRIVEQLGESRTGVVYLAQDLELRRRIVLKILRDDLIQHPEERARFLREGKRIARFSHPCVAKIHEVGESDGRLFVASEFVEGRSLQFLIPARSFDARQIARIGIQIADGLEAAHSQGIAHLHLKPSLIIVSDDGETRILGLDPTTTLDSVSRPEIGSEDETRVSTMLTEESSATVGYLSPEQARGASNDHRADLFTLGTILYEMATGKRPFSGRTPRDTLASIQREEPVPAVVLNPELPESLVTILSRCLAKDPDKRTRSAGDLARELRQFVGAATESGPASTISALTSSTARQDAAPEIEPPSAKPLSGRRWSLLVGSVVTAAVLAMAVPGVRNREKGAILNTTPIENSLAVMTFQNLSRQNDPERFGQIMQELIITGLSEIDDLRVLSSQRLYDVQKQVRPSESSQDTVSGQIKVARGAGARTMLAGTLDRKQNGWTVTANLISVDSGVVVDTESIRGHDLYTIVDKLTERIRGKLRVPTADQVPATPVIERTTASLEAYRLYLSGLESLNRGLYEMAADTLDAAVRLDPTFSKAHYKLAIAFWWTGHDFERAEELLSRLVEVDIPTTQQERVMAEAALALVQQDWEASASLYREVLDQYPDEKEAWYGFGEALFHSMIFPEEETLEAFEHAIELDPSFAIAYRHIFDIASRRGEFRQALERIREFASKYPETTVYHRWAVGLASQWGNPSEIEHAMADALRSQPIHEDWRRILTDCSVGYWTRGDLLGALRILHKAQEIDSEGLDPYWYTAYVGISRDLRDWDRIEKALDDFLDRFPDRKDTHDAWTANLLLDRGEYMEALQIARNRLEGDPTDLNRFVQVADCFSRTGDRSQLETLRDAVFRSALTQGEKIQFLKASSWCAFQEGDIDLALEWMETALARDPFGTVPIQRIQLAWILARLGRINEAEVIFRAVEGSDSPRIEAGIGLATLDLWRGRYDRVESRCRAALDAELRFAPFYQLLCQALLELNRPGDALPYATTLLEMNPSHTSLVMLSWSLIASEADLERGVSLALKARDQVPLSRTERLWLHPSLPSPEHCLAVAYLKRGQLVAAEAMLREAAEKRPDRERILSDLMQIRDLP